MEFTSFETVIKNFLDNRAQEDPQFAVTYAKPHKSVEECCKYITQEVKKSNKNRLSCVPVKDEEVFGLAIHYYDEDDIKVEGPKSTVKVAQSTPAKEEEPTTSEAPEEKQRKARKPRKSKTEVDPNIPDPLDIPFF